ncbi:MAG: hypothetical protein AAB342_04235 [Chloroflexota bacterium]
MLNRARLENSTPLKRLLWRDVIEQTDGGKPTLAQAGGKDPTRLAGALGQ